MADDDKTIGEVYRRLVDMDERTEKKLDRIETEVRRTNGRTTTLEANVKHLDSEVRTLKHQHLHQPQTPPALPSVAPTGEYSISFSPSMWKALAALGGGILAMLLELARHRLMTP